MLKSSREACSTLVSRFDSCVGCLIHCCQIKPPANRVNSNPCALKLSKDGKMPNAGMVKTEFGVCLKHLLLQALDPLADEDDGQEIKHRPLIPKKRFKGIFFPNLKISNATKEGDEAKDNPEC